MVETHEMWIGFKRNPEEHLNRNYNGITFIQFLGETKTEYFTFAGLPASQKMAKYLVEVDKGETNND